MLGLQRKDMPTHLKESLVTHMSLQAASYSKLLANHDELLASHNNLLGMCNELQEKVRKLEQHVSMPTLGYVESTMENFEQHKKDNDWWFSQPFYTHPGGYKFCLRVDANGWGDGGGTHISVFVCLMRGEFDDHLNFPFRGNITVQLVDQEREKEHCTETITFTDRTPDDSAGRVAEGERQARAWGKPQFIPSGEQKPKYLKNDCLRFRITKITLDK